MDDADYAGAGKNLAELFRAVEIGEVGGDERAEVRRRPRGVERDHVEAVLEELPHGALAEPAGGPGDDRFHR